ncbi:gustatory receptor 8a-like [Calliphora vicina]|uniref:gustatory receptor 8a-like n=1 Tax=Calliphora vicina TaxID=7373 RepID=UPI00325AC700
MNAHIPKILRIHMVVFKIAGYCGLSLNDNLKRRVIIENWLTLWSSLLLVAFNIATLVTLKNDDEFLFSNDEFGYFNDILKVVFADIAVTISYLESILKRSELRKFWTIYGCLQKQSDDERNYISVKELWENRRFLGIFYTYIILEFVVTILFVILQPMSRHVFLFNLVFTPFICAVHLRNMQYIFYIEILRLELVKLQQDLNLMVDYTRFVAYGCGFKGFENFLRKKLLEKQKHYQMIYEMFENFQNGFGFSITAVILMIYVRVLVDAYFSYYTFYRDWNKTGMLTGFSFGE